jgi:hypothetical protein
MTKISRTVPDALAEAVPAVTAIPVLPKPITKSFTVTDSPAASDAIVPDFVFPMKINDPSRSIDQSISVISVVPVFLMVAETPSPPLIVISTAGASTVKS